MPVRRGVELRLTARPQDGRGRGASGHPGGIQAADHGCASRSAIDWLHHCRGQCARSLKRVEPGREGPIPPTTNSFKPWVIVPQVGRQNSSRLRICVQAVAQPVWDAGRWRAPRLPADRPTDHRDAGRYACADLWTSLILRSRGTCVRSKSNAPSGQGGPARRSGQLRNARATRRAPTAHGLGDVDTAIAWQHRRVSAR